MRRSRRCAKWMSWRSSSMPRRARDGRRVRVEPAREGHPAGRARPQQDRPGVESGAAAADGAGAALARLRRHRPGLGRDRRWRRSARTRPARAVARGRADLSRRLSDRPARARDGRRDGARESAGAYARRAAVLDRGRGRRVRRDRTRASCCASTAPSGWSRSRRNRS